MQAGPPPRSPADPDASLQVLMAGPWGGGHLGQQLFTSLWGSMSAFEQLAKSCSSVSQLKVSLASAAVGRAGLRYTGDPPPWSLGRWLCPPGVPDLTQVSVRLPNHLPGSPAAVYLYPPSDPSPFLPLMINELHRAGAMGGPLGCPSPAEGLAPSSEV